MSGDVTCPFCGRDPFHYVDNGVGMEAVAVTCCELGNEYFRGARDAPEEVTLSWEEFCEIGRRLLSSSAAERAVVEALEMAEGTLLIASRMLTEDHKMVLNGKRWGDKTIKAVNAALSSVRGEGGDKQARSPSALSAPISTDTKGTTK